MLNLFVQRLSRDLAKKRGDLQEKLGEGNWDYAEGKVLAGKAQGLKMAATIVEETFREYSIEDDDDGDI